MKVLKVGLASAAGIAGLLVTSYIVILCSESGTDHIARMEEEIQVWMQRLQSNDLSRETRAKIQRKIDLNVETIRRVQKILEKHSPWAADAA